VTRKLFRFQQALQTIDYWRVLLLNPFIKSIITIKASSVIATMEPQETPVWPTQSSIANQPKLLARGQPCVDEGNPENFFRHAKWYGSAFFDRTSCVYFLIKVSRWQNRSWKLRRRLTAVVKAVRDLVRINS
jgi:hypothetical protein